TRSNGKAIPENFQTVFLYDSIEDEQKAFRQLSSNVKVKGQDYVLTVRMSVVDNDDLVTTIALVQLALSVVLAVGLLLLNRTLSKKLWRPFYNTLNQLKAYELDKSGSVREEKCNIVEFDDLNKTVSNLTRRNREVFLQQKEFIENASHELQTPIAIFQTKLDSLMQNPRLSKNEAETIMELEATAQRMARLNKNLLLFSKIDNDQYVEIENIDIASVLQSHIGALKPLAELENISIDANLHPLGVSANRTLLEILVTNLLHNAIRYSPKRSTVRITLDNRRLSIVNAGAPLRMDAEKMMERFSKESTDPNSTGLGLAIVKNICEKYSYRLEYRYEQGAHKFSVMF
ncbi:MAG TPA: HAMP domain-containing sensor histidine kinase, partial [Chryseosolibacter sp.]|nr:HAMP domain-containing sensor histidine kinase [Chryseosolibacter sp.]